MFIRIIATILLFTISVFAQTGSLSGRITCTDKPVGAVNVQIINSGLGTVTDDNGCYQINKIKAGFYSVKFSSIGYNTEIIPMQILPDTETKINVELNTIVIPLNKVEILNSNERDISTSFKDIKVSEVQEMPGAMNDVFRVIQTIPGVIISNDYLSQFSIRGGTYDQNLILLDDVEIFNPYRLYGVMSMFNPEIISEMNFYSGGFPAQYGGRLSSVLDVNTREGNSTKYLSGGINSNLLSANILLEGKLPETLKGSWILSYRRTYYDLFAKPFFENYGLSYNTTTLPNFYDLYSKISLEPFSNHKILFSTFISSSNASLDNYNSFTNYDEIDIFDKSKNNLFSLAWHYIPDRNLTNKVIISWSFNKGCNNLSGNTLDPAFIPLSETEDIDLNRSHFQKFVSADMNYLFSKLTIDNKSEISFGHNNKITSGIGIDFIKSTVKIDDEISPSVKASLSNSNTGLFISQINEIVYHTKYKFYLQNEIKVFPDFTIAPGLRIDYYELLNKAYTSPRINFLYELNNNFNLTGALGIFYQAPGFEKVFDTGIMLNFNKSNSKNLKAEESIHNILGIEYHDKDWLLKTEVYYKKYDNLIGNKLVTTSKYSSSLKPGEHPLYFYSWNIPELTEYDSITNVPVNNSTGKAYGIEFTIENKNIIGYDLLSGGIYYSYSKAERTENGITSPFKFDRRHNINILLNYKPAEWFDIGLRFQYGSGLPITTPVGIKPRIVLLDRNKDGIPETPILVPHARYFNEVGDHPAFDIDYGEPENKFNERDFPYRRLDLRFNFRMLIYGLNTNLYLDIINVLNQFNYKTQRFSASPDFTIEATGTQLTPFLPTIGINVKF